MSAYRDHYRSNWISIYWNIKDFLNFIGRLLLYDFFFQPPLIKVNFSSKLMIL